MQFAWSTPNFIISGDSFPGPLTHGEGVKRNVFPWIPTLKRRRRRRRRPRRLGEGAIAGEPTPEHGRRLRRCRRCRGRCPCIRRRRCLFTVSLSRRGSRFAGLQEVGASSGGAASALRRSSPRCHPSRHPLG